jgi:transposase
MPWLEIDVRNERIRFVVAALRGEESTSAVCRRFGISRKTGYKWLARYKSVGSLSELCEQSRRPRQNPRRSRDATEQRVLELRERYGWGSRKLQQLLVDEGVKLSRSTIDRILDRHGVARSSPHARPAPKRFERSQPNELVQMDFKGQYRLAPQGWCYPLSLLDDHSRFALALEGLESLHGSGVEATLRATFEREGVPRAMLMDHGAPWWSPANGHGLTEVSVFLIRQGVDLVHSGIAHPQTQGKVERFHRTLEA